MATGGDSITDVAADFQWELRVRASPAAGGGSTVYARQHRFEAGDPVSFDSEHERITPLEYAAGALGSELVEALKRAARRRRVKLDSVEAAITARLVRPLAYLRVVGEEGVPLLGPVTITVYAASDSPPDDIERAWTETLEAAPLYQTLRLATQVDAEFRLVG